MTMRARRARPFLVVAMAIVTIALASCGRKTLPIPPHEALPEAIRDLAYQQDESQVVLTWTYPKTTTVGSEVAGIQSFLVLRAVVPNKDYCAECPVTFNTVMEVEAKEAITDPKSRQARYTETILRPGHRYLYKVRTKAGWRVESDDSNTVVFTWDAPALAPEGVTSEAGDGQVQLSWQPVSTLVNGEPVNGPLLYQVYRGQATEEPRPVGEAVAKTVYDDSGLVNGQTYRYQVRAVRESSGTRLIGLASRSVEGTPRDLTPPAPPRKLTAVRVNGGVKLLWERGTEKDLAGYRIYRRLPEEAKPTKIGEVGRDALTFIDQLPQAPEGCNWAVTAFDKAEPANESGFSKELYHESF